MKISPNIALLMALMVLSACAQPRKACRRAEKHIAKAIYLCPEALHPDTTTRTATLQVPAESLMSELRWSQADMDSVLAACDQVREALDQERALYIAGVTTRSDKKSTPMTATTPRAASAVAALRRQACQFEPFTLQNDRVKVTVRPGTDRPLITLEAKPWQQVVKCPPCPPQVTMGEVKVDGGGRFYRYGFWCLLLLVLVYLAGRYGGRLLKLMAMVALLLPMALPAQTTVETLSERTPGQRQLVLAGILSGSDSAYVQVYHDGEELMADVFVTTWTLTLASFDWYVIKFTDGRHRVKLLFVAELSDDLTEFYPPIEIDFDREGDLALIKKSHRKPQWLEIDVGMSRHVKQ